jgi:hypothetical protein
MIRVSYLPDQHRFTIEANGRTHRGRSFPVARRILRALNYTTAEAEAMLAAAFVVAFVKPFPAT